MIGLFLLVAGTHFAALLSPGPDFFLLIRAALLHGRRQADGCAAGIALANLLSMLLVLLALAALPGANGGLWRSLQLVGGGYFCWLGSQALLARRELQLPDGSGETGGRWRAGFGQGLLASSLNPKLPLFYAGLFGVLREAAVPGWGPGAGDGLDGGGGARLGPGAGAPARPRALAWLAAPAGAHARPSVRRIAAGARWLVAGDRCAGVMACACSPSARRQLCGGGTY